MKIGLYGVAFQSTNKGCEALAYSSLEILNEIAKSRGDLFEVYIIQKMPTKLWIKSGFSTKKVIKTICPEIGFDYIKVAFILPLHSKDKILYHPALSKLDVVLDFTEGDSFSDIYGLNRFYSDTDFKLLMMRHGIPYILGSQTVGPFKDSKVRARAAEVLNLCNEIFVRDSLSFECVKETSGRTPILTTDIAFRLPYRKSVVKRNNKILVGFNPSGLLWQSETVNSRSINLSLDYHRYCEEVVKFFLDQENVELILVPHANSIKPDGSDELDSDLIPCRELKEKFPSVVLPAPFHTAMEAKGFISGLDFFVGSRMHATIAALSTGVPVVPVSYSRKFEGLFGSVNYDYMIHGQEDDTDSATRNTKEWFENREKLYDAVIESKIIADKKLEPFVSGIQKYLK